MTGALQIATPGNRELVMTRVFDAPRRLVFDALTRPELIRRWYGERGWTMVVSDVARWSLSSGHDPRRSGDLRQARGAPVFSLI